MLQVLNRGPVFEANEPRNRGLRDSVAAVRNEKEQGEACSLASTKFGSIEQNLPQPFLMVDIGLTGRRGGPRGQRPLVRELRHSIRLG